MDEEEEDNEGGARWRGASRAGGRGYDDGESGDQQKTGPLGDIQKKKKNSNKKRRQKTKRRVEKKSRLVVGVCWWCGDWDGSGGEERVR